MQKEKRFPCFTASCLVCPSPLLLKLVVLTASALRSILRILSTHSIRPYWLKCMQRRRKEGRRKMIRGHHISHANFSPLSSFLFIDALPGIESTTEISIPFSHIHMETWMILCVKGKKRRGSLCNIVWHERRRLWHIHARDTEANDENMETKIVKGKKVEDQEKMHGAYNVRKG